MKILHGNFCWSDKEGDFQEIAHPKDRLNGSWLSLCLLDVISLTRLLYVISCVCFKCERVNIRPKLFVFILYGEIYD